MKHYLFLVLIACLIALPSFADGSDRGADSGADMIVWEHQNWETNGGYNRLTIWRDGRSEIEVAPLGHSPGGQTNLRTKTGWTMVRYPDHVIFVRRNVYPPEVVRAKFQQALDAGILLLKSFKPGYVDGSGTLVVVRIGVQRKETVIPMFMDRDKGTLNHKRFLAVSKVLDGFDTNAYEIDAK